MPEGRPTLVVPPAWHVRQPHRSAATLAALRFTRNAPSRPARFAFSSSTSSRIVSTPSFTHAQSSSATRLVLHRWRGAKAPDSIAAASVPTQLPSLSSTELYPHLLVTSDSPLIRVQENWGRPTAGGQALCLGSGLESAHDHQIPPASHMATGSAYSAGHHGSHVGPVEIPISTSAVVAGHTRRYATASARCPAAVCLPFTVGRIRAASLLACSPAVWSFAVCTSARRRSRSPRGPSCCTATRSSTEVTLAWHTPW